MLNKFFTDLLQWKLHFSLILYFAGDENVGLTPTRSQSVEFFANGSLVIHNVKNDNAGSYECEISNAIGGGIKKIIRISVSGKI